MKPEAPPFAYCPFYCEENVWHLCSDPRVACEDGRVLVVSNAGHQVALWRQRAGSAGHDGLVVWDYHVIFAGLAEGAWFVWDLDTTLGCPVPATQYLAQTFMPVPAAYAPVFRMVDAARYREVLGSDRRHMLDASGQFRQRPPTWPAIGAEHNLERWIDMRDDWIGELLELEELRLRLSTP